MYFIFDVKPLRICILNNSIKFNNSGTIQYIYNLFEIRILIWMLINIFEKIICSTIHNKKDKSDWKKISLNHHRTQDIPYMQIGTYIKNLSSYKNMVFKFRNQL